MSTRGFYRLAVLLPLLGFALAAAIRAALGADEAAPAVPGGRTESLYPSSLLRGMLAYAGVAVWAWRGLQRGPADEAARRLWRAPLLFVLLGWVVAGLPALAYGQALRLLAEERELVVLRTVVKLAVGYAYLALIHWAAVRWVQRSDVAPGHSAGA